MLSSLGFCLCVLLIPVMSIPEPNPEDLHIHLHGLDKVVKGSEAEEAAKGKMKVCLFKENLGTDKKDMLPNKSKRTKT